MGDPSPQIPSDLDEYEDGDDEGGEEGERVRKEYRDPLKGGSRSTRLVVANSEYIGDWGARHGWRELYQNWFAARSYFLHTH
jgi:hypothetical protein